MAPTSPPVDHAAGVAPSGTGCEDFLQLGRHGGYCDVDDLASIVDAAPSFSHP